MYHTIIKIFSVMSSVLLICIMLTLSLSALEDNNEVETIMLVHTNDVHGVVGVEPYVRAVADSYRQEYGEKNVLTLSAGDVFSGGNAIAHMTDGEAIVDIMNAAGYDAMTAGNNDVSQISLLIAHNSETTFPIMAANLVSYESAAKITPLLDEYKIFTSNSGVRIGVFGVTTILGSGSVSGKLFYSEGTIQTAKRMTQKLKKEEACDIVVALAHTGWPDGDATLQAATTNDTNSYLLATSVDGIDVVIDGHSHSIIEAGNGMLCDNGTLIVQAGSRGGYIGTVTISINKSDKTVLKKQAKLLSRKEYTKYTPDAATLTEIEKWENYMNEKYGKIVAYTPYFLNGERKLDSADGCGIRAAEQNLGDLVTDAVRYAAKSDIAFISGVRIRGSIQKGDISMLDFYNIFPVGMTIGVTEMSGKKIKEYLRNSVADSAKLLESSAFVQISGISFTYSANDGSIINAYLEDGTPVNDNHIYTVASESGSKVISSTDEMIQAVINYFNSTDFKAEKYAAPQGRITRISANESAAISSTQTKTESTVKQVSVTTAKKKLDASPNTGDQLQNLIFMILICTFGLAFIRISLKKMHK